MKYKIEEKIDEEGIVIEIPENKKRIEIKAVDGLPNEEFCIDDLTNQIALVERQIQNIIDAKEEGDGSEIESLLVEMEMHAGKIKEVKDRFNLSVELPKIKTVEEIEEKFKVIEIIDSITQI